MAQRVDRRDEILNAALRLADAEGLSGLTVRALCKEVGVSAPVIYRYFADKEAILQGVARRMLGADSLEPPSAEQPLGEWLFAAFLRMRREILAHPQLLALLTRTDAMLEQAMAVSDTILAALDKSDLQSWERGACFHALMAYTTGSAGMARTTEATQDQLAPVVTKYEHVLRNGPAIDPRADQVFERGLRGVLRGFGFQPRG